MHEVNHEAAAATSELTYPFPSTPEPGQVLSVAAIDSHQGTPGATLTLSPSGTTITVQNNNGATVTAQAPKSIVRVSVTTDADGNALRHDGSAIPGLYAAGNTMAAVTREFYPAPGTPIGTGVVFAYRAVQHMLAR